MLELTRQLLERYLRATGWRSLARERSTKWYRNGGEEWFIDCVGDPLIDIIDSVWSHEGQQGEDLRFRLGLCAASEYIWREGDEPVEYRDLLRAAGVDPAAWEAARA